MYLPLRYICETLGASVTWNPDTKEATVARGEKSKTTGEKIVNDVMMTPPDFFEDVFGAKTRQLSYNIITINTNGKKTTEAEALAVLPRYNNYTEEDLEWLSKIVEAEAKGESYPSKLGVANVIINRRDSGLYPSTIKDVIFDRKYGVQFTPTINGAINNSPSTESYIAALEALEGRNNAEHTLFFMNPVIAKSNWIANNRQYAFTIGRHSYYY
jgi:N-acetylmuramoyl-L-alanine amidase